MVQTIATSDDFQATKRKNKTPDYERKLKKVKGNQFKKIKNNPSETEKLESIRLSNPNHTHNQKRNRN